MADRKPATNKRPSAPAARRHKRSSGKTAKAKVARERTIVKNQRAFLAAYAKVGNITKAAEAAGITRKCHSLWSDKNRAGAAKYLAEFEEARAEAIDHLEAEARRRAVEGVNEPVIYKGELMGIWLNSAGERVAEGAPGASFVPLTVKKHSDVLLIFLLKAADPEKYRDRTDTRHSGPSGGVIPIAVGGGTIEQLRQELLENEPFLEQQRSQHDS